MAIKIITNIGTMLSGDIGSPILPGDTIVIDGDTILETGDSSLLEKYKSETVIDAAGSTVTPGLFDSHVHVTSGDYAPRQKTLNFIDSALHGGVTTMISAGEAHAPGRPKDPEGAKALAVCTSKSFYNAPPSGVKVHGGALILEKGLKKEDFSYLKGQGVWLVGEIGLGSVKDPAEAAEMVEWAKAEGFKVQMHTGGTSIPGSSTVTASDVMTVKPDVVSHINGGPTAIDLSEVDQIMEGSELCIEIVHCGNPRVADYVARKAVETDQMHRVIFGNDSPSGSGIMPLGILRNICFMASLSGVAPEQAVCCATGNTAKVYGLDSGIIAPGKKADLVIMDAPMGSVADDALSAFAAGDIPGISMVMINGDVKVKTSRNTPPAKRKAE